LLLAPHDSLAHVEIPGARGGAVDVGVGAANHLVPGPSLAVDVEEVGVAGHRVRRGRPRRDPVEPAETQGEGGHCTRLKELPPSQGCHFTSRRAPWIPAPVDDRRRGYPPSPGGGMTTVIGTRARRRGHRGWRVSGMQRLRFSPGPARPPPARDPPHR
jgi:hypothetical protein